MDEKQYINDNPEPEINARGGDGGDGFNPGAGGIGYRPSTIGPRQDGTDGTDNEATAGLGIKPGIAINGPNATINIIDAGTINGPTNY